MIDEKEPEHCGHECVRYIEVKTCFGCKNCVENKNPPVWWSQRWMCHPGKDQPSRPLDAPAMSIPDWCPLPVLHNTRHRPAPTGEQMYAITESEVEWWESGKPFSKEERKEFCNGIRSRPLSCNSPNAQDSCMEQPPRRSRNHPSCYQWK